jgi:hypothetical protein
MTNDVLEQHTSARRPIWRNAVIYTPAALIIVVLFFVSLFGLLAGKAGAILPVILLGLVGFAFVFESLAALRDLRSEPTVTEGEVDRIWKKSKLLIFGRQDYLLVRKQVFEIGPISATELSIGQTVSIQHWPHTMRVIAVRRVRPADIRSLVPHAERRVTSTR